MISRSRWKPSIGVTILLVVVILWLGVPNFLIWRANVQVTKLCDIDGGINIYDTVILPPEMFNQWGQINFHVPNADENALGPAYKFIFELTYLKRGRPEVLKFFTKIIRRSDEKVIGESTSYVRRGGDPIGPWVGTSFVCPSRDEVSQHALFRKVFIPNDIGEQPR